MASIKAQLLGQKLVKKQNRDFSINIQHLILLRLNVLLESNIMQSNIYTSKMHSHKNSENPLKPSKLETSEKASKLVK